MAAAATAAAAAATARARARARARTGGAHEEVKALNGVGRRRRLPLNGQQLGRPPPAQVGQLGLEVGVVPRAAVAALVAAAAAAGRRRRRHRHRFVARVHRRLDCARRGGARRRERERGAGNGGEHGAWRRGAQKRRRERGDTPAIRASSSSEVASRAAAAALEDMPRELRVWRARARFERLKNEKAARRAPAGAAQGKGQCQGTWQREPPPCILSARRPFKSPAARRRRSPRPG